MGRLQQWERHMSEEGEAAIERPVLVLGLLGFSPDEEVRIGRAVEEHASAHVWWQLGHVGQADAWLVSGPRTRLLPDRHLTVAPGSPDGQQVRIALDDRPLAFSEPVRLSPLAPEHRFTLESESSIWECLANLEKTSLLPTAAMLWLAARIVADDPQLKARVYHVTRGGEVLAIVDRVGNVGVCKGIGPAELETGQWVPAPSSAPRMPGGCFVTSFSELVWRYALRTVEDLLPPRYRSTLIYFRRPPKVPQRLLDDEHLVVMRELALGASSFDQLAETTGFNPTRLAAVLAALYLTGSITTNHSRAHDTRPPEAAHREALGADPGARRASGRDATVPAMLPGSPRPKDT